MSKRALKNTKRRRKAVVPVLGITGLSLSLASGATASTGEATAVGSTTQPHEIFLGEEEVFDTSLSTFYTFDKENGDQGSLAQQLKLARGGGGCGCGGCGHGGGCGGCGHGGCAAGAGVGCAGGARVACAMGGIGRAGIVACAAGGVGRAGVVRGWSCGVGVHCRCAFFRRCFGCGCGGCGWGCGGGWGCGTCWIWTPTWGWINTCWSDATPAGEDSRVASQQIAQTAMAEEKK